MNERDSDVVLSEAGRSRRQRMQRELLGEMQRIHRARRRRRTSIAASLLLAIVGGFWIVRIAPPSVPPLPHTPKLAEKPAESDRSIAQQPIRISRIEQSVPGITQQIATDSTILDRYRIDEVPNRVTYLTDEQLVRELAAIGEPVSVVRLPDRVLLVRADRKREQQKQ